MMDGHTPTPWGYEEGITPFYNDANGYSCGGDGTGTADIYQVDEKGNALFDAEGEPLFVNVFDVDNAALIVRAVNSHEALVEAATNALDNLDGIAQGNDIPSMVIRAAPRAALSQARS